MNTVDIINVVVISLIAVIIIYIIYSAWSISPNTEHGMAKILDNDAGKCLVEINGERQFIHLCKYIIGESIEVYQTNNGKWNIK